jgi:hypothetical protein
MTQVTRNKEDHLLLSTIQAIGRTPLIELSRLTRDLDGRILTKFADSIRARDVSAHGTRPPLPPP